MPEIYGLHFDTQEELDAALARLGEALERINEAERRAHQCPNDCGRYADEGDDQ